MTSSSQTYGADRMMETATPAPGPAVAVPERRSYLADWAAALMPRLFAKETVVYETQNWDSGKDR